MGIHSLNLTEIIGEVKIEDLMDKYGSDKNINVYAKTTYSPLFTPIKKSVRKVLEIGIGTGKSNLPHSYYPLWDHYKIGGSLRAWRDFFPNAIIHGIDIEDDCMFEEDRIVTFLGDSLDANFVHTIDEDYDIIVDDGCHEAHCQAYTFVNFFPQT